MGLNLVLAWAAAAEISIPGDLATLRWTAASGPVDGYEVWVARNGGASALETGTGATEITLRGTPGDVIQVRVRAFNMVDGPNAPFAYGPLSPASEAIRFAVSPPPESFAILDCPSCGRVDFRLLPSGTAAPSVAHPPGGPWDVIHVGHFAAGDGVQIAFRQRTTGELWVGDYTGSSVVHRASFLQPGSERLALLAATDFDGDGLEEILARDTSTGSISFFLLEGNELLSAPAYTFVDPSWNLLGAADLDRDGQMDLWFDSHRDEIWVFHTYQLLSLKQTSIPIYQDGFVAVDVADYDGDAAPDLLLRSSTGALTLGLLRGDPGVPQVQYRALPLLAGDDLLTPRASADLDGLPGAEILLQTSRWSSGTLDAVFPASADPAQRQRLLTTDAGSKLVQVLR